MVTCSACWESVQSPYEDGKLYYCPQCYEDLLRREARNRYHHDMQVAIDRITQREKTKPRDRQSWYASVKIV